MMRVDAASGLEREKSIQSIDRTLGGFIAQLFQQQRRSALPAPGGGVIVSNPITVDQILRDPLQFPKTFDWMGMLGRNRFSTDGSEWEARRDLTQRQYLRAGTVHNAATVAEVYRRRLESCDERDAASVARALLAASTEIFYDAFGCQVDVESMMQFFDDARPLLTRLQYYSLIPPGSAERAALEQEADALLNRYLAQIKASPSLRALIGDLQSKGQSSIEDFDALQEFLINFFAGVESTTATLSTVIDRLGFFQDTQHRLAEEVMSDAPSPVLECFLNEVLRCYPAVPIVVRKTTSDVEIESLRLRAGSVITISVIGVHRHPNFWKAPDQFDGARAEFVENSYDRRAFIPFSTGVRSCGGARLARLELVEGLKAFLRHFVVQPCGEKISFYYTGALRPQVWDHIELARR